MPFPNASIFTEIALSLVPISNAPTWVKALWIEKELAVRGLWRDDVFELVRPFLVSTGSASPCQEPPHLPALEPILQQVDPRPDIVVTRHVQTPAEAELGQRDLQDEQETDESKVRPVEPTVSRFVAGSRKLLTEQPTPANDRSDSGGDAQSNDSLATDEQEPVDDYDTEPNDWLAKAKSLLRYDALTEEQAEIASIMHMLAVSTRLEKGAADAALNYVLPEADETGLQSRIESDLSTDFDWHKLEPVEDASDSINEIDSGDAETKDVIEIEWEVKPEPESEPGLISVIARFSDELAEPVLPVAELPADGITENETEPFELGVELTDEPTEVLDTRVVESAPQDAKRPTELVNVSQDLAESLVQRVTDDLLETWSAPMESTPQVVSETKSEIQSVGALRSLEQLTEADLDIYASSMDSEPSPTWKGSDEQPDDFGAWANAWMEAMQSRKSVDDASPEANSEDSTMWKAPTHGVPEDRKDVSSPKSKHDNLVKETELQNVPSDPGVTNELKKTKTDVQSHGKMKSGTTNNTTPAVEDADVDVISKRSSDSEKSSSGPATHETTMPGRRSHLINRHVVKAKVARSASTRNSQPNTIQAQPEKSVHIDSEKKSANDLSVRTTSTGRKTDGTATTPAARRARSVQTSVRRKSNKSTVVERTGHESVRKTESATPKVENTSKVGILEGTTKPVKNRPSAALKVVNPKKNTASRNAKKHATSMPTEDRKAVAIGGAAAHEAVEKRVAAASAVELTAAAPDKTSPRKRGKLSKNRTQTPVSGHAVERIVASPEASAVRPEDDANAAAIASSYGIHIDSQSAAERSKLLFFVSALKTAGGDWTGSEEQLSTALEAIGQSDLPLIWKRAIEQSIEIHRRLNRRAS